MLCIFEKRIETMSDTHKKNPVLQGYLFAIGATAIWAGNFIIARGLNDNIPPVSLAFFRWLVAVIVFTPFALKGVVDEWAIIKKHIKYPVYIFSNFCEKCINI